jgi:hypothetical protein
MNIDYDIVNQLSQGVALRGEIVMKNETYESKYVNKFKNIR